MATFQRAEKATEEMLFKVLRETYPELFALTDKKAHGTKRLTFDVLDVWADEDANGEPKGPPLRAQGRAAAATIQIVSKANRALGQGDVLIKLDRNYWDKLNDEQREALLDHELYHLALKKEAETDAVKRDDLGRVMFGMRHHDYDFGWFIEVAKRRGLASPEVQQAKRIMAENGQWLFNFADTPELRVVNADEDATESATAGRGRRAASRS